MARHVRHEQRTILSSHETPSSDFVNHFKVSHKLSDALSAERKSCATGQAAFLRKKAQQGAYVEEARKRQKPPLPNITAQQEVLAEIRRDAPTEVPVAEETQEGRAEREKKRQAFLDSRKARHSEADDSFEQAVEELAERCKADAAEAARRMKRDVDIADQSIEQLLHPLEADTEKLGEKTEEEVEDVMDQLNGVIASRKNRIKEFSTELERIEHGRREESERLLKQLVEKCTAAAHVVPGELERIVENKSLAVNYALLENTKATQTLAAKLQVQTLEKSKENKVRWHRGQLLWKQKRHKHSIEQVMKRIASMEFRQPQSLMDVLERFREAQVKVYDERKAILNECFETPLKALSTRLVKDWEEQNTSLNDAAQEGFDSLLAELKELKDLLDISAENMLSVLMQELENHDARQEWKGHESVTDLVNADVRPALQECLDIVSKLLIEINEAFNKQEEVQHSNCVNVLKFFSRLAAKHEKLKKGAAEVDNNYKCEIEDAVEQFRDSKSTMERKMKKLQDEDIADCVHHNDLDDLRTEAFNQLDELAALYRSHAEETTDIHKGYPDRVAEFFQPETEGFCQELGLITEEKIDEEKAAAEESGSPSPFVNDAGEEVELEAWPEGDGSKCAIFLRISVAQLREQILDASPASLPPDDATMLPGEAPAADDGKDNAPGRDSAETVPRMSDGSEALQTLHIEADWLDERLEQERRIVFMELTTKRDQLDSVNIADAIEKIRQELDHRLRQHTNRKGEVQVEYYLPRYTMISKHKDKFERHIIDIAKKSQEHDQTVADLLESIEQLKTDYEADLAALEEKFPQAEALPMLLKIQREAIDAANKFKEAGQQIKTKLMDLATKKPEALKKNNHDFINSCRTGEEKYGVSEINFYASQLNDLNSQLDQRKSERKDKANELDGKLEGMRKEPYATFSENYQKAEEELCATKGLGRKHGEPRRNAQERCRTLNTWGAGARHEIGLLSSYLSALCEVPADGAIEVTMLPTYSAFSVREVFKRQNSEWVFTAEVLGAFSVLVCALDALGTHLSAFKEAHGSRYSVVKLVTLLEEGTAVPDDASKTAEQDVRQYCLGRVMGPLLGSPAYNTVIESIEKSSHEVYASKGGTPGFMQTFLDDMSESAKRSRLDAAINVREVCDELRENTLLKLGEAVFGELTTRSLRRLRQRTEEVRRASAPYWEKSDADRETHDEALNPKLANPNNEKDLISLVEREADRFDAAVVKVAEDRVRMVECLRAEAETFLRCLAARFEVTLALVDALPLHGHFIPLPGDEQVEAPRMSIKRRLRRKESGESKIDADADGLPEKQWSGLPRYELRKFLCGSPWPPDEELAEASPDTFAERTPAVASFRSPVHRQLYDRRTYFYETYRNEFEAEVRKHGMELNAREQREQVGEKTFGLSARQLSAEVVTKALEERRRRIEEEKEAALAAAAPPEPPPTKGKK